MNSLVLDVLHGIHQIKGHQISPKCLRQTIWILINKRDLNDVWAARLKRPGARLPFSPLYCSKELARSFHPHSASPASGVYLGTAQVVWRCKKSHTIKALLGWTRVVRKSFPFALDQHESRREREERAGPNTVKPGPQKRRTPADSGPAPLQLLHRNRKPTERAFKQSFKWASTCSQGSSRKGQSLIVPRYVCSPFESSFNGVRSCSCSVAFICWWRWRASGPRHGSPCTSLIGSSVCNRSSPKIIPNTLWHSVHNWPTWWNEIQCHGSAHPQVWQVCIDHYIMTMSDLPIASLALSDFWSVFFSSSSFL